MKKTTMKLFSIILYTLVITSVEIGMIYNHHPVWFLTFNIISIISLFLILGFMGWLKLDDKSLLKQPLFLVSILLPLHSFIIYGIWSWTGHSILFSSKGFSNFIEISKLPLLLLASSVPLASIVNNIHRTIQTERQILEAQQKNIQDSYSNHRKFHLELYSKIEGKDVEEDINNKINDDGKSHAYKLYVKYPLELYRKSYKSTSQGINNNIEIDKKFLEELKLNWIEINKILKSIYKGGDENERVINYKNLTLAYVNTCKHLCLGGYHCDRSFILDSFNTDHQFWSIFFKFNTLYKCLLSLENITHSYLDTCYDGTVKKYFTLDGSLVEIGPGVYHDWLHYFEFVALSDYSQPRMTTISTLKPV